MAQQQQLARDHVQPRQLLNEIIEEEDVDHVQVGEDGDVEAVENGYSTDENDEGNPSRQSLPFSPASKSLESVRFGQLVAVAVEVKRAKLLQDQPPPLPILLRGGRKQLIRGKDQLKRKPLTRCRILKI